MMAPTAAAAIPAAARPGGTDWDTIAGLVAWIDAKSIVPPETDKILRIVKLSEDVGEVSQALIGVLGQNVRKGVTHTWDDVEKELCDVIITAMVALRTLTPDAEQVFADSLARVAGRTNPAGPKPDDVPAGDALLPQPTPEQELLASIWLHVGWRAVTRQLTTEQKDLWADVVDMHLAWCAATDPSWGEPAAPVDRWWRDA